MAASKVVRNQASRAVISPSSFWVASRTSCYEPKMGFGSAQQSIFNASAGTPPRKEALHLGGHPLGGRCFVVHAFATDGSRDDLQGPLSSVGFDREAIGQPGLLRGGRSHRATKGSECCSSVAEWQRRHTQPQQWHPR